MRLFVFYLPPLAVLNLSKASHTQSSIRSSSMRFSSLSPWLPAERALSELRRGGQRCQLSTWRGRPPNQYLGNTRCPLTFSGRASCDGSTVEFRIVDLITHHDVGADE